MAIFRFIMLMIVLIDELKSSLAMKFFILIMMMDLEHPKIFENQTLTHM